MQSRSEYFKNRAAERRIKASTAATEALRRELDRMADDYEKLARDFLGTPKPASAASH